VYEPLDTSVNTGLQHDRYTNRKRLGETKLWSIQPIKRSWFEPRSLEYKAMSVKRATSFAVVEFKEHKFGLVWLMQPGHKMLVSAVICEWADGWRQEHRRGRAISLKAQWVGKLTSLLPVKFSTDRRIHCQNHRRHLHLPCLLTSDSFFCEWWKNPWRPWSRRGRRVFNTQCIRSGDVVQNSDWAFEYKKISWWYG